MELKIEDSWKNVLKEEFEKPYFEELRQFVAHEYEHQRCFPPKEEIFAAFQHCSFSEVKAVILGQDPYHGQGQANGLCFSVHDGIKHPPSLVNIFKELTVDTNQLYPASGDLSSWASQGVLLLNATLTVREGEAGSHQRKGWELFTDAVIAKLSEEKEGLVFMLWGGYAKKKGRKIATSKHTVLEAGHPSPLSANRGFWFGNKHFSSANRALEQRSLSPIQW